MYPAMEKRKKKEEREREEEKVDVGREGEKDRGLKRRLLVGPPFPPSLPPQLSLSREMNDHRRHIENPGQPDQQRPYLARKRENERLGSSPRGLEACFFIERVGRDRTSTVIEVLTGTQRKRVYKFRRNFRRTAGRGKSEEREKEEIWRRDVHRLWIFRRLLSVKVRQTA